MVGCICVWKVRMSSLRSSTITWSYIPMSTILPIHGKINITLCCLLRLLLRLRMNLWLCCWIAETIMWRDQQNQGLQPSTAWEQGSLSFQKGFDTLTASLILNYTIHCLFYWGEIEVFVIYSFLFANRRKSYAKQTHCLWQLWIGLFIGVLNKVNIIMHYMYTPAVRN